MVQGSGGVGIRGGFNSVSSTLRGIGAKNRNRNRAEHLHPGSNPEAKTGAKTKIKFNNGELWDGKSKPENQTKTWCSIGNLGRIKLPFMAEHEEERRITANP